MNYYPCRALGFLAVTAMLYVDLNHDSNWLAIDITMVKHYSVNSLSAPTIDYHCYNHVQYALKKCQKRSVTFPLHGANVYWEWCENSIKTVSSILCSIPFHFKIIADSSV